MSDPNPDRAASQLTVEEWLQIRKAEALRIDPETAEVMWSFGYTLDPYGVHPDLPEELQQVGREYFARTPGSDIWVHFGDLPDETRKRLWKMYGHRLVSFVVSAAGVTWNISEPLPLTVDKEPGLN